MRSFRRRWVQAAAVTASVVLVAACGAKSPNANGTNGPDGTGATGQALTLTPGTLLVSDGTNVVAIGDQKVTFPTTVTDAAWSPDGSRIAFVDGDGNVATARPNGTDVVRLTANNPSVVRSRPSWSRAFIFYAEKRADGASALMSVSTNGCGDGGTPAAGQEWQMDTGEGTSYVDLAPTAALSVRPSRVAFQHNEPGGPEIWINDTNQRVPRTYRAVKGSEPALSSDGERLAYVGGNGQVFLTTAGENAAAGVQITFGTNRPTHLTFTPDGQHLTYGTPNAIESVGVLPGANSNPATTVASSSGVPAYLGSTKNEVNRLNGSDPIAVSVAASQARWPTAQQFSFGQGYLGALGAIITAPGQALGAATTAAYPGPLLLTSAASLDPRTKAELERIFGTVVPNAATPEITIVGNEVSAGVEQALQNMGYHTTRKHGAEVPATPGNVCGPQLGADLFQQVLVVVNSSSATDNAVATALALGWHTPILRINGGDALTDAQRAFLARTSGSFESVYIVDSSGGVSADVEKRIAELVSGPAGFATRANPAAPPLN